MLGQTVYSIIILLSRYEGFKKEEHSIAHYRHFAVLITSMYNFCRLSMLMSSGYQKSNLACVSYYDYQYHMLFATWALKLFSSILSPTRFYHLTSITTLTCTSNLCYWAAGVSAHSMLDGEKRILLSIYLTATYTITSSTIVMIDRTSPQSQCIRYRWEPAVKIYI